MKVLINRLSALPNYDKSLQWGKLIAMTGGAQTLVQITGGISGILIIRMLSTQEYALYTLANTMLGTMVMLADNGISSGVMGEAGKVWQDRVKLGVVLSTGLYMRKKFAVYTLIVTLPILAYLLLEHKASLFSTVLIMAGIMLAFVASLSDSLLEITPKLHQNISQLQRNQVEVNIGRLIFTVLVVITLPFTFAVLIANGIPRLYGNYKLKKISNQFAEHSDVRDSAVEDKVMIGVKRTLPIVVYHCLSGQISIWLTSIFGTTASIAQIGALGRLSMLFALFSVIFSTLVVPRFSRMSANRNALLKHFTLIQFSAFCISAILLLLTWIFTDKILFVLGKNYSNLHYELLLVAITNCIGLISGIGSQLVISRGWFLKPFYFIGTSFALTTIFIAFFDMSSLVNILYYGIATTALPYFITLIFGVIQIREVHA